MSFYQQNTAYDFFQAWNSVKKNNTKEYADLLRQLETKRLAKGRYSLWDGEVVLSNAMVKVESRMEWRKKRGKGRGSGRDGEGRDGTGQDGK